MSIDPIFQQQQQQYFYNKSLERAKQAQREKKRSRLRLGVILGIVFIAAFAVVFVLGGGLRTVGSHHVIVDGISYRVDGERTVISMEDGFSAAGELVFTEDLKHAGQDFATDWPVESTVYVNPGDRDKIYLRWQGHYLECPRQKGLFG